MRPRLEQITLKGFKTIRELERFEPGNLTVLIGPNGAGKSNFLSFFRMLWASLYEQLQRYVGQQGGASTILHRGPAVTDEIVASLSVAGAGGLNVYRFQLEHAADDTFIYASETLWSESSSPPNPTTVLGAGYREARLLDPRWAGDRAPAAMAIGNMLRRIVVYQFHNTSPKARIRNKWDAADGHDMKGDGGNTGAFLAHLQAAHPAYYRRIVETIRLILPFFADFELRPDFGKILLQWREVGSDQILSASQASDGMLRVFALVALLYQPEQNLPDVLIIDEPELGLHPYAIEVIANLIAAVSQHVQVIVATQSVSLIDHFEPSDIVVVDRHEGETTFRRLEESKLAEWLKEYTLSELWEKNVLGGRPSR